MIQARSRVIGLGYRPDLAEPRMPLAATTVGLCLSAIKRVIDIVGLNVVDLVRIRMVKVPGAGQREAPRASECAIAIATILPAVVSPSTPSRLVLA